MKNVPPTASRSTQRSTSTAPTLKRSHSNGKALGCVYLNARSVKGVNQRQNKLALLHNMISTFAVEFIAITETWLTNNILDSEVLPPHFQVHRKDRSETCISDRGGGLLLGVDQRLPSKRRKDLEGNCEIMVCELLCKSRSKIAIVLCYRPPSSDRPAFNTCLEQTLDRVSSIYRHVCVLGDFNMPEIDWRQPLNNISPSDSDFIRIIQSNSLVQFNTFPSNRHSNFLDLIFTTDDGLLCDLSVLECEFPTDHNVLSFSLNLTRDALNSFQRIAFNYKRADLDRLNNILRHVSLDGGNGDDLTDTIDTLWSALNEQVVSAVEQCVPKVTIKSSRDPPWFDAECRRLTRTKRILWRKAKRRNTENMWRRYRHYSNFVKAFLKRRHDTYIDSLGALCVENPKRFWSFFRGKLKSRSTPADVTDGNQTCNVAKEKASLFNNFFCSVFSQPGNLITANAPFREPHPIPVPTFTAAEIKIVLRNLDVHKACPPNDISPFILKNCCASLSPLLAIVFNRSLYDGKVPSDWKKAYVVPIFKKGDRSHVKNYRPVSLLQGVSKVLERCIVNFVYPFVSPLLHNLQHGFLKKRSCTTQLLKVYHTIGEILDRGGQVDIVYLDFSKAFDCVCHSMLLYKLEHFYGFTNGFIEWFKSYLTSRSQCVVLDGENSEWKPVTSGVPQGSILGPLLFLLFINDMPDVVTSSTTALFADDCKLFREIKSAQDCILLQSDLNALHEWSNRWKMTFNPAKCKVLTIARSRSPVTFDYQIDGTNLEHVGDFKDLGVVFDETLSFKNHINSIVSKCNRMCGFVKRSIGFNAPQKVKLTLFKTLIRPLSEYSSQVWSPHFKKEISLLEGIQRSYTRFICSTELSYPERCISQRILPLSYRREIADLLFCFKYLNGSLDIDYSNELRVFTPNNVLRSSHNGLILSETRTRTELFKASYFNRLPRIWNALPYDVRMCNTFQTFKSKLVSFYFTKLESQYDVFNPCTWISTCRCTGFYHN